MTPTLYSCFIRLIVTKIVNYFCVWIINLESLQRNLTVSKQVYVFHLDYTFVIVVPINVEK